MIKRAIKKILALPKTIKASKTISSLSDGDYSLGNVSYQCQFATPELVEDILEGRIDAKDDPNWMTFGMKTKEEYAYWATRGCGICCIKMVLDSYGKSASIAQLIDEGVVLGGYDVDTDAGWYHEPLVKVAEKHGLHGFVSSYLSRDDLAVCILNKQFVIASVSPTIIRMDKTISSKRKSGHLVLVTGFKVEKGRIVGYYINNPSGKTPEMRKNAYIPTKIFIDAYGERGIVLNR